MLYFRQLHKMHTHTHTCTHMHTHTRTHTHTYTHAHAHTHTRTHTCMHAHARTHTHTHTHTHTPTPTVEAVVFCSMSPLQASLYSHLTRTQITRLHSRHTNDMSQHLVCIGALKKVCNSPNLLYTAAQANSDSMDVRLEWLMC